MYAPSVHINGSLFRAPTDITTAQTIDGINKQIAQNKKDLPAAIAANQAAGAVNGNEGASAISGALNISRHHHALSGCRLTGA